MVFLLLFLEFFVIGLCAFGGGLASIPFLEDLCVRYPEWFSHSDLVNMIAISESTPGAIGINMSTYVGYQAVFREYGSYSLGFLGGMVSTLGFASPSIIVIIIISQFLKKFKESKYVKWAFYGLRAASIGLIIAAAYSVLKVSIINVDAFLEAYKGLSINNMWTEIWPMISNSLIALFDFKALALALLLGILIFKYKKHPILYILLAAVIGIILQM